MSRPFILKWHNNKKKYGTFINVHAYSIHLAIILHYIHYSNINKVKWTSDMGRGTNVPFVQIQ